MKRFISSLAFICFISIVTFSQNEYMKFQGVARDADGEALANTTLQVKFYIYPDTDDYDSFWMEQQNLDTDGYGVFTASIGIINDVDYRAINFIAANYKLRVDFEINGIDVMVSDEVLQSVPYARSADNGVPPGCIMPFAGPSANIPSGWAICDGSSLATETYPYLYAAIGNAWGGDATNFNLPDLRGSFLRGVDAARGLDEDAGSRTASNGGNNGDNVGSYQESINAEHIHSASGSTGGGGGTHSHYIAIVDYEQTTWATSGDYIMSNYYNQGTNHLAPGVQATKGRTSNALEGNHTHSVSVTVDNSGGNEARPVNYYVNYIIKL